MAYFELACFTIIQRCIGQNSQKFVMYFYFLSVSRTLNLIKILVCRLCALNKLGLLQFAQLSTFIWKVAPPRGACFRERCRRRKKDKRKKPSTRRYLNSRSRGFHYSAGLLQMPISHSATDFCIIVLPSFESKLAAPRVRN